MFKNLTFSLCTLLLILLRSDFAFAKLQRQALIIGNSEYQGGASLTNPVNDASDMAQALRKLDFDVMHHQNLTYREMLKAVRKFSTRTGDYAVNLFYFAGHAVQISDGNFLIASDTDMDIREPELRHEALSAARALDMMLDRTTLQSTNIFILDACRNNPFRSFRRSLSRGLTAMEGGINTYIAFATAPGSTAADGGGRNGTYTSFILKHINKPGITIENMFKRVRIDVLNETGYKQVPWENSSLRTDFCFVTCDKQAQLSHKNFTCLNIEINA